MYRSARRVLCESSTTGAGALTLGAAVAGYRTLADAVTASDLLAGDTVPYAVEAVDSEGVPTGDFEVGRGTVGSGGTTLTRDSVEVSSNSNALVSFAAGTKYVYLVEEDEPHATTFGYSGENKGSGTVASGSPVAVHSSGVGVVAGDAATSGRDCIGLALESTAVGFSVDVRTQGLFTLSDWSAVTTEASVTLSAKATYYLSATAGKLTATAPTTTGQRVQVVGRAVSTETLELAIGESILL